MKTLAVVMSIVGLAAAAQIGERCTSNGMCPGDKAYCKIGSPSCGAGVCSCVPGYMQDSDGVCRRAVALNAACRTGDLCSVPNTECSGGSCQCSRGYVTGPRGTDCVAKTATLTIGGKCYDSIQCYYNLRCRENQCKCYDGFVATSGGYECRKRGIDDACDSNTDCSQLPNSECVKDAGKDQGKCKCVSGFKEYTYMSSETTRTKVCYSNSQTLATEGKSCNTTLDGRGDGVLCAQPFYCTTCDGANGQRCGRVVPMQSAADKTTVVAALVGLLAVVAAL